MSAENSSVIAEMLRLANQGHPVGLEPTILLNQNINAHMVTELTTCYVNESWAPKMKELIEEGWVLFRVQTQFGMSGHETIAYFAKLRQV